MPNDEDPLSKAVIMLAQRVIDLERNYLQLHAGLTVLKSQLAMELHRENPKAFLEQLRALETRLLAEKDSGAQARQEAADALDVLLQHDPDIDSPDA